MSVASARAQGAAISSGRRPTRSTRPAEPMPVASWATGYAAKISAATVSEKASRSANTGSAGATIVNSRVSRPMSPVAVQKTTARLWRPSPCSTSTAAPR
jgi:hypothetical protein